MFDNRLQFLVVGPRTALKYGNVFPRIMSDEMWLGYGFSGGNAYFKIDPSNAGMYAKGVYDPETGCVHFRNCEWYTNLDVSYRHDRLILTEDYEEERYPKYVNYDAIEVPTIASIPGDYAGAMGVPITFLSKYNPEQFEILGMNWSVLENAILSTDIRENHSVARRLNFYLDKPDGNGNNYTRMYDRLVIRNRNPRAADE